MSTLKRPPQRGQGPQDVNLSYEGMPYRGPVQDYSDKDPEEKLPQISMEAHVGIFVMNDEKQKQEYTKVVQKLVKDEAVLSYEEKEYDPELKTWRILIVYSDIFYEAPKADAT